MTLRKNMPEFEPNEDAKAAADLKSDNATSSLKYNFFPKATLVLPRLGLGSMSVDKENSSIIDEALKHDIVLFDAVNCYGNGESEKALGEIIKKYDRKKNNYFHQGRC